MNIVQSGNNEIEGNERAQMFVFQTTNRVRNFRGRVSNFNQSDARKQCVLASDWLKFVTLPRKCHTLFVEKILFEFLQIVL